MPDSAAGTGNPFWDFSLAVYGRPGVPALCLDLQDRRGVDVNLLLFAAWAGRECGVRLTVNELAGIDAAVAVWRDGMVRPLRALRRQAKQEDAALYARLKAAELEAERVQQDRLLVASGFRPGPGGSRDLAAANMALVVSSEEAAVEALARCL